MLNSQTADSVIDHALSLGADFAELFVEKNATNVVSTLSDEVQSVESGINFGIGLRLVYGSKVLYGYTNRTDRDELMRIASVLAAKDLRDPVSTKTAFDYIQPSNIHPASKILSVDAAIASKVAYLMAADQAARAVGEQISQTRGNCLQREQNVAAERFQTEIIQERARQQIEEAKGIAEAQQIISEGLTPEYLTFFYIEQLGQMPPGSVIYVPTEGGVPLMRNIGN